MMPEAPTSVPATISRSLSSTKPDAATARPVNEFSSEISTGTSAPPMGSTKITPSTSASTEDDPDVDDAPGDQRQDRP